MSVYGVPVGKSIETLEAIEMVAPTGYARGTVSLFTMPFEILALIADGLRSAGENGGWISTSDLWITTALGMFQGGMGAEREQMTFGFYPSPAAGVTRTAFEVQVQASGEPWVTVVDKDGSPGFSFAMRYMSPMSPMSPFRPTANLAPTA